SQAGLLRRTTGDSRQPCLAVVTEQFNSANPGSGGNLCSCPYDCCDVLARVPTLVTAPTVCVRTHLLLRRTAPLLQYGRYSIPTGSAGRCVRRLFLPNRATDASCYRVLVYLRVV